MEGAALPAASSRTGPATTLILVRHGVTPHTAAKKFSGGLKSSNPGLSDEGRDQVRATADWLAPIAERIDAVVASPVRRTLESAEIIAERLGRAVDVEPGFAEMEFGRWDGLTFAEVAERDQARLDAWLGSMDTPPPGGESFRAVQERVLAGLDRVLEAHAGRTVVVVSHVTPIKTLVAQALTAPLESVLRMQLSPASVTVLSFYPVVRRGSSTPRCGSTTHGLRATTRSRPPPRPGDWHRVIGGLLLGCALAPLALVHRDHAGDRDLVALGRPGRRAALRCAIAAAQWSPRRAARPRSGP